MNGSVARIYKGGVDRLKRHNERATVVVQVAAV